MKKWLVIFKILTVCATTVCFAHSYKVSSPGRHPIRNLFKITTAGYEMWISPGTQITFDNSGNANWVRPDGIRIKRMFVPSDDGKWFLVPDYSTGNTLFTSTVDHRTIVRKIDLSQTRVENLTNCVWLPDNRRWVQVYGNSKGLNEIVRDMNFPNSKDIIPLGIPRATNGWGGYNCTLIGALNKNHILAIGSHTQSHRVLLFTFDTIKRSKILYTELIVPDISHVNEAAYSRKYNKIAFVGNFDSQNDADSIVEAKISEYRIVVCEFNDRNVLKLKSMKSIFTSRDPQNSEAGKLGPRNLMWRKNGAIQFVYHNQLYVIDGQ